LGDRAATPAEQPGAESGASTAAAEAHGRRLPGQAALRADDAFVVSAYRVLREHFGLFLENEAGTRLGENPDCLHDMRVASRRVREALKLFAGVLPQRRVEVLRRDLGRIGRALGRVRDLDVYRERFHELAATLDVKYAVVLTRIEVILRDKRDRARRAMLRALDSRRYAAFVGRFGRFLDAGPPKSAGAGPARKRTAVVAPLMIEKRLKKALREGRRADANSSALALHALRKHLKQLRYACEFFADMYGPEARRFAATVRGLQDILGAHQDAVVAQDMLGRLAEGVRAPKGELTRLHLALGQLQAIERRQAAGKRSAFAKAWRKFDRKRERGPLRKRMQRLRRGAID